MTQAHTIEAVCRKLDLRASDRVVEIGTGQNDFALYAAATRGCDVTTTSSKDALDMAQDRVRAAEMRHLIDIQIDNRRRMRGTFDKLVSIDMVHAVGHDDLGTFLECCSLLLAPGGLMLLRGSTVDDLLPESTTHSGSAGARPRPDRWLPSVQVILETVACTDMCAVDIEVFPPQQLALIEMVLAKPGGRLEKSPIRPGGEGPLRIDQRLRGYAL